jgi:hypothetical protein
MKLRTLHNIYEAIRDSRLLYGAEIWGIRRAERKLTVSKEVLKNKLGISR